MPNPRWKIKPAGSTWGDFGPDDQLGRLNLVTPDKVKQGVAEVNEGLSFCLSMPLDFPGGNILNPRRKPPQLAPTMRGGKPNMTYPLSRDDPKLVDVVCDDVVLLTLQYSTQWDSLAHVGQQFDVDGDGKLEMVFYNGYRAGEDIVGPLDYRGRQGGRHRRPQGRDAPRHREHGEVLYAGPRRDDRPARAFRPRAAGWSATKT